MRVRALPAVVVLFVLSFLASASHAQQLPASSEVIDVSIINVDVFVTDKKGNRVYGLTADDFEIRENGKAQPITNFAEYAPDAKKDAGTVSVESRAEATPEAVSAAPPTKRTIVLFIDLLPQPSARVHEVFAALRGFVDRAVRPGDAATVVAFDSRLRTRQQFTDDKAALNAALTQLESESIGLARDVRGSYFDAKASDDAAKQYVAAMGKGDASSTLDLERRAGELFELVDMSRKTAAMTSLMEGMSGIEGKKIMVLALQNFGFNVGVNGFMRSVGPVQSDLRIERLRESVMRTANANGVTLYPFLPLGLQWNTAPHVQEQRADVQQISEVDDLSRLGADNNVLMNQTASYMQLAKETGGLMAAGPADVAELLPRVVDDLESYYSLAYRATATGKDARRKIVVTAKNRDYEVRSRRAVVEKSDDTQMDDRVVANLFQPAEHSVIPVAVEVGNVKRNGKNRWLVPIKVRIPIANLMSSAGDLKSHGSFSVFVAAGADFGVASDVTRKTQEFTIAAGDFEKASRSHFTYNATVEVDGYAQAISVGVRDDVSKDYGLAIGAIPSRVSEKEKRGGSLD